MDCIPQVQIMFYPVWKAIALWWLE